MQVAKGIQVKHWHDRLFFVRPIIDFDEDGNPILGKSFAVSRYDSKGALFHPDGPFEVRKKSGKIRMIPCQRPHA